jgi:glucokinase
VASILRAELPALGEFAARAEVHGGLYTKGRFKELMARIPIHMVTMRAALVGAAAYGLESLKNIKRAA